MKLELIKIRWFVRGRRFFILITKNFLITTIWIIFWLIQGSQMIKKSIKVSRFPQFFEALTWWSFWVKSASKGSSKVLRFFFGFKVDEGFSRLSISDCQYRFDFRFGFESTIPFLECSSAFVDFSASTISMGLSGSSPSLSITKKESSSNIPSSRLTSFGLSCWIFVTVSSSSIFRVISIGRVKNYIYYYQTYPKWF